MKKLIFAFALFVFTGSCFAQGKKIVKLKIAEPQEQAEVSANSLVYPNPTDDIVNVPLPLLDEDITIRLVSSEGKVLETKTVTENVSIYPLSLIDYPQGSYFIQVILPKKTTTYTVIKK